MNATRIDAATDLVEEILGLMQSWTVYPDDPQHIRAGFGAEHGDALRPGIDLMDFTSDLPDFISVDEILVPRPATASEALAIIGDHRRRLDGVRDGFHFIIIANAEATEELRRPMYRLGEVSHVSTIHEWTKSWINFDGDRRWPEEVLQTTFDQAVKILWEPRFIGLAKRENRIAHKALMSRGSFEQTTNADPFAEFREVLKDVPLGGIQRQVVDAILQARGAIKVDDLVDRIETWAGADNWKSASRDLRRKLEGTGWTVSQIDGKATIRKISPGGENAT